MSSDPKKIQMLFEKLKDYDFCEGFKEEKASLEVGKVMWSKFLAYNVLPFYSELTGYKLDRLSEQKFNGANYKYTFNSGKMLIIEEFGKHGNVLSREYLDSTDDAVISLEFDEDGMPCRMKYLELVRGLPMHGYMVDDSGCYWSYDYVIQGEKIISLRDFSKNSAKPFVVLEICYDSNNGVSGLVSVCNGETRRIHLK